MTNQINKKQIVKKSGFNPMTVAVTGAIVGAGVAIAGAIALNDETNRKKVKQVLTDARGQAVDYVKKIQKEIKDKKSNAEKKFVDVKKEIGKATISIKNTILSKEVVNKKTEIKGKKKLAA